jgi:light-regulated signal transduction histidine kinase (bacteriophytochrome)
VNCGRRTAELEASNQELEDLIYTLSHDLRAPVRHITGFVKLLLENELEQLEPESANHLHVINMASQRLGRMIDDLLTFSRLNRRPLRVRPVELATVVANVQSKITSKLKQRQIIWEIGRLPVVSGDPSLLEIAWTHLVNNSVKFTASRAEATIEIGMDPSDSEPAVGVHEVVLFVRDNGVGFDQQYAHKLFRVFQRLHHENEFGGTGIGLAIVSRIIQRHGGKIWARGEIDHGATFYFTLPKPTGDQNGSKTDFVG